MVVSMGYLLCNGPSSGGVEGSGGCGAQCVTTGAAWSNATRVKDLCN